MNSVKWRHFWAFPNSLFFGLKGLVSQILAPLFATSLLVTSLLAVSLTAASLLVVPPPMARAHNGSLDEYGGHFNEKTGKYHYHRPTKNRVSRKRAVLSWVEFEKTGVLKGWVEKLERPNAFWIRIDYRPAYIDLVPLVSKNNRDDAKQLLRIWMKHVSPEETGRLSKKFSKAFNERVLFEFKRKAAGKRVSVHFDVVGTGAGRMRGLAFIEEENLNLWMVSSGWSFYVLGDGKNQYDRLFREAEDHARRKKSGIWRAIK